MAKFLTIDEHLKELKYRLILIISFFLIFLIISFYFSVPIFSWLKKYAFVGDVIFTRSPADSLLVYLQISFLLAFFLTFPFIIFHFFRFISPGLTETEKRWLFIYFPFALGLFLIGLLFNFMVVFPLVMKFLQQLNKSMGLKQMYSVYDAFRFLLGIVFPLSLFFELPLITIFLTKLGILSPLKLSKGRKYGYFMLVILAVLFGPPDILSILIVLIPLLLLYELSIILCKVVAD